MTRKLVTGTRLVAMSLLLVLAGCGPATFTRSKIVWEPFDARENRQQRDNVTVELKFVDGLPPSFFATVPRCDALGRIAVDKNGRPFPETITLGTNDQVWQQIAVTNDTQNVIRLNGVVVRLFDPAGTQYNVLTKADLQAELLAKRPCPSTQQAMGIFAANSIFDRNIEIVPGTTSTFYVAFKPATRTMTGVWKIALYDVPVSVDPAGRPLRTTRFETRMTVKQVNETFRQENLLAKPELLERTEQTPSGTRVTTPPQAVSTAATQTVAPSAPPAPPTAATAVSLARAATTAATPVSTTPANPAQFATAGSSVPAGQAASATTIRRVQARLNALGFQSGAPDGRFGNRTRQALQAFQQARGLATTGEIDASTLSALGIQ